MSFASDVEPPLSEELSAEVQHTHYKLLQHFAQVQPNFLRGEIRRYRRLLKRLSDWANRQPDLWTLAHRAHWWESYWFEREYGDSQFESFRPEARAHEVDLEFNRRHASLIAPLIPLEALRRDLREVALGGTQSMKSLALFAKSPGLQNFRVVVERATPSVRQQLLATVEQVLREVSDLDVSSQFVDFLDQLPAFSVTSSQHRLQVLLQDGTTVVIADARSVATWIGHDAIRHHFREDIEIELETDIGALIQAVASRAVA